MIPWKRGFLEIIAQILDNLLKNSLKKSGISIHCNLDSRALTKYLSVMESIGLVKKSKKDPSFYVITQKGIDFVYQYGLLVGIIESDLKKIGYKKFTKKK